MVWKEAKADNGNTTRRKKNHRKTRNTYMDGIEEIA